MLCFCSRSSAPPKARRASPFLLLRAALLAALLWPTAGWALETPTIDRALKTHSKWFQRSNGKILTRVRGGKEEILRGASMMPQGGHVVEKIHATKVTQQHIAEVMNGRELPHKLFVEFLACAHQAVSKDARLPELENLVKMFEGQSMGGQVPFVNGVHRAIAELGVHSLLVGRRIGDAQDALLAENRKALLATAAQLGMSAKDLAAIIKHSQEVWRNHGFEEGLQRLSTMREIRRYFAGPIPAYFEKEQLWPWLAQWVEGQINDAANKDKSIVLPHFYGGHYADGAWSALLTAFRLAQPEVQQRFSGQPHIKKALEQGIYGYYVQGHSLGAQKVDNYLVSGLKKEGFDFNDAHALRQHARDLGLQRLKASPLYAAMKKVLVELDKTYHFTNRVTFEALQMRQPSLAFISTSTNKVEWNGKLAEDGLEGQWAHPIYGTLTQETTHLNNPPGISSDTFAPKLLPTDYGTIAEFEHQLARKAGAENQNKPVILYSARMDEKKNVVGLLRGYIEGGLKGKSLLVINANLKPKKGSQEAAVLHEIKQLIKEHGLKKHVLLVSFAGQGKMAAIYRHLTEHRPNSVFAMPSQMEPFGLAQLEAMASGLPAVATKIGGPAESMLDDRGKVVGELLDPYSPEDIGQALAKIVTMPVKEWKELSKRGAAFAQERYHWQRHADQIIGRAMMFLGEQAERAAAGQPPGKHTVPQNMLELNPDKFRNAIRPEDFADIYIAAITRSEHEVPRNELFDYVAAEAAP